MTVYPNTSKQQCLFLMSKPNLGYTFSLLIYILSRVQLAQALKQTFESRQFSKHPSWGERKGGWGERRGGGGGGEWGLAEGRKLKKSRKK